MPLKYGFGMWLRIEREARGMSMAALAHKVGITYTHISKIEGGRAQPSREMVRQLVKALDADLRTGLLIARLLPPEFQGLTDKRLQEIVINFPTLSPEAQEKILTIAHSSNNKAENTPMPQEKPAGKNGASHSHHHPLFEGLPVEVLEMSIRIAEKMVEVNKELQNGNGFTNGRNGSASPDLPILERAKK